jgi:uncharacterized protein with GYD domain
MPTFITLANWTDQGIKNLKESPSRLDAFKQAAQKLGGEVKGFYLVTGKYDMVLITEAPDGERWRSCLLMIGSQGGVRTETLRAFPEGAYREIIAALP